MKAIYRVEFTVDSEAKMDEILVAVTKGLHTEFNTKHIGKPSDVKLNMREKVMKTFKVTAEVTTLATIEINAYTADEAKDIASNLDGGDFESVEDEGSWKLTDVTEV